MTNPVHLVYMNYINKQLMKNIFWLKDNIKDSDKLQASVGTPDFFYCVFTVDKSQENYYEFTVGFLKCVSIVIFDIMSSRIYESFKLGLYIGCMEVTSNGLYNIAIKGIPEATILLRKEVCDEYSPLFKSE